MMEMKLDGQKAEVQAFVRYLEAQPYFELDVREEEQGYDQFTLWCALKTSLLKPSLRSVHEVEITTEDQQKIKFTLLDAKVEKVGGKMTITGLNYDVFA
jgi:hypothetical protein